jgi:hypothetical protein
MWKLLNDLSSLFCIFGCLVIDVKMSIRLQSLCTIWKPGRRPPYCQLIVAWYLDVGLWGSRSDPSDLLVTRTPSTTVEGRGHKESSNHYKRAYYNTKSIPPPLPIFLYCKWGALFRGGREQKGLYLYMVH